MTALAPGQASSSAAAPRTFVDAFAAVVAARGEATAVTSPGSSLSYAELGERARTCARRLAALVPAGTRRDAPLAVLATPSAEMVVAMCGVLLTGHPLVVLDAQLPAGRLQQIHDMAGAAVCVVGEGLHDRAAEVRGLDVVTTLEEATAAPGSDDPTTLDGWAPGPSDTATIVFTSGSTGRPKGVVRSHGFILDEASITGRIMDLEPGDRTGLALPPSYALGEHAVFGTLLRGASLHVYDPRDHGLRGLSAWLRHQQVTVLPMTPSLLRALAGSMPAGDPLRDLRLIVTAGEALQGRDVRIARERIARVTVANHLGSSEVGQLTFGPVGPDDPVPDGVVPAGPVVEGKEVQILDEDGNPLPIGEAGTMRVLGTWLTSYLDPVPDDPFGRAGDGRRSYTMNDRGRFDHSGVLRQLGRTDDAVKVNGYLVEPVEVEVAMRGLEGVADVAVVARRDATSTRLIGYVAPATDQRTPSPAQLRKELSALLPSWQIPAEIVMLTEIPRNERGKVDRAALPEAHRPVPEPLRGHWEEVVAAVYRAVLNRTDIGPDETLTALGGDSLAVEEVITRLHEGCGVWLTGSTVAEASSIRELAAVLAAKVAEQPTKRLAGIGAGQGRHSSLVTVRGSGTRAPLLCFTGAGAAAHVFLPLAEALGPDHPVRVFQPHGLENWTLPDPTVRTAARRHLRRVRAIQPTGPYRILGHSMGALIGLEVARLLAEAGEEVAAVHLIDAVLPQRRVERAWRRERPGAVVPPPPPEDDETRSPSTRAAVWRRRGLALTSPLIPPSRARSEGVLVLGIRTSLMHRPRPWAGRAVVYVSHQNAGSLVVWRGLLTGAAEFVTLQGEHNSLLRAPHVEEIARLVTQDPDASGS